MFDRWAGAIAFQNQPGSSASACGENRLRMTTVASVAGGPVSRHKIRRPPSSKRRKAVAVNRPSPSFRSVLANRRNLPGRDRTGNSALDVKVLRAGGKAGDRPEDVAFEQRPSIRI